jgi:hypothetical protein
MRKVVALAVVVVLGAAASPSRAEMPASVAVAGEGDCPAPAALARALARLHPALRIDDGGEVRVAVFDRGGRYEVQAGGRARTLDDPARRCVERATAAALAATLMLDPPSAPPPEEPEGPLAPRETPTPTPVVVEPAPTKTEAPAKVEAPARIEAPPTRLAAAPSPSPPRAEPAAVVATRPAASAPSPSRRPSRIDLELVGLVDGAPALASSASEVTGGAALRLSVGGRYVAGTFGFTGLAPTTATSAGIDVRVVRLPFDAGVRLLLPFGRLEPGIDAGLALAILQLSAGSLDGASTNTRLDVGARIAPFLRIGLTSRLALVLGVQMIVSFAPYDLVVTGVGQIATTPRLWLGGGLGLAARL